MSSSKELIDIVVQLHHETERAVLVSDTGIRDDAVWLPKSQIEYVPGPKPGTIEVTLPEWLAVDKDLI